MTDDVDDAGQQLRNWTAAGAAVTRAPAGWVASCLFCRRLLCVSADRDEAIEWAMTHTERAHNRTFF